MKIIYIDSLFFINLLTDYMLCLCTGRICGIKLRRLRYLAGALLGAGYSAFAVLPGFNFLLSPAMKLTAGFSMALIAFAGEQKPLHCTFIFFAVSAAFGGALWAMGLGGGLEGQYSRISVKFLLTSFTLCYSLGSLIFRSKLRASEAAKFSVRLSFLGRDAEFTALHDTGNSLTDPLTGCAVMLISPWALKSIFGENTVLFETLSPVELIEAASSLPSLRGKLRLISFSSLGGSGMLPLFRPERVLVDGKEEKELMAAVSPEAAGDGFDAII